METWFWILGWSLSILTMAGNGFVIFIVCRKRQLRTKTNAFVVSLAVADFFVGMSVVPPKYFCNGASGCNPQDVKYRLITSFIVELFLYASAVNLCSLVLDRYMAIVKPLKYLTFMKRRRVVQMISLSWTISVSFTVFVGTLYYSLKTPVVFNIIGLVLCSFWVSLKFYCNLLLCIHVRCCLPARSIYSHISQTVTFWPSSFL